MRLPVAACHATVSAPQKHCSHFLVNSSRSAYQPGPAIRIQYTRCKRLRINIFETVPIDDEFHMDEVYSRDVATRDISIN